MTLVEQYTKISDEIIANNQDIQDYEKELNERENYIDNLLISNSLLEMIMHPIKLMNTRKEQLKIKKVKNGYFKLKNKSIVENIAEESGDFGEDLYNAARYTKPNGLEEYSRIYSVDNLKNNKKLLKERK